MKTRALSLIIIFTALAVALNIYGPKIPFPPAPFLFFSFWEIPIVIAFLMVGPRAGLAVSLINALILFAVFPGALPTGPLYNWIAIISMMLGVYVPYWIAKRGCKSENFASYLRSHLVIIGLSATVLGILTRVAVMTAVNYFALPQDYPIGFSMPQIDVLLFLPLGALFNAIVAIYTITIALGTTVAVTAKINF